MPKKQYIKRFNEWIKLKKILHDRNRKTGFKEGEIWWCGCGENVGVEINGKTDRFARPVLIYKKLNRHSFLAIPISTQIKTGSWYVKFTFKKMLRVAVLSQIKVMSVYRLYDRMGELDNFDMDKIIAGFNALYKKSSPSRLEARGRG